MKNLYYFILIIIIISSVDIRANNGDGETECVLSKTTSWNGQIGGYALPSEGTINVLFIFAQFPDDNYDKSNLTWIKGQAPANMQSWVDQTWSSNPTEGSMTHYFNEMSFNKLKFTGKEVSVITPHSRAWYLANNKNRGYIHKEIIEQLDETWDFGEFDNWDYEGDYNHINRPDGIIDMIFIVWRNVANDFPSDSVKIVFQKLNMGRYADLGGSPITVDNGQRTIKTGFWPDTTNKIPGGSGATMTDWFTEDMFRFCIHEFGHYLQGGNDQHVGYGFWGLLSGWGIKSYIANSFERYRLGWINLNTIKASSILTIQNATLPDFISTGIAYRFVIDSASSQYFYIENHQNHTRWKYSDATIEDGIYILRQDGAKGDNTFIQLVPADGRWEWVVNQLTPNPWGSGDLPVFKKLNVDRVNGYHDLQYIPWSWNGITKAATAIHFLENSNGQPVQDVRYTGDGKDAFRTNYNEIFSPWSNPNSDKANRTATPFGFKINNLTNGIYSIDIYVNTSLNAPPSKPQNVKIGWSSDNYAELTWESNIEPDIQSYKIYKESAGSGMYITVAHDPNKTVQSWKDLEVKKPSLRDTKVNCQYKIIAIDNTNKQSLASNEVSILGKTNYIWKNNSNNNDDEISSTINDYKLFTNYPNPFNPTTKISFNVKEQGNVRLIVFNSLGEQVNELVNQFMDSGSYSVQFNASNLPSGIYFYSFEVNGFREVKKMMLVK